MSDPYEHLRQIIRDANMRVLDRPTPQPAQPGGLRYAQALYHALSTGPRGCAVQVSMTAAEADRTAYRVRKVMEANSDGRTLTRRKITGRGATDPVQTYVHEFTLEETA